MTEASSVPERTKKPFVGGAELNFHVEVLSQWRAMVTQR